MSEVLPIRDAVESAPADVAQAIGAAYQKAAAKLSYGFCAMPWQQACTLLLDAIVDNAARGMRDVDQLCDEALASLRNQNS